MENKVIWIDDDPDAMRGVIPVIFRSLWKAKIKSEIYILGDYAKREKNIPDDAFNRKIKELNDVAFNEFISFLIDNNFMDDDKATSQYHLINSNKNLKPESDIAINKNIELNENNKDTITDWKNIILEKSGSNGSDNEQTSPEMLKKYRELKDAQIEKNSTVESENMYNVKSIFDRINMNDPKCVLIDLCLLEYDYKKLTELVINDSGIKYIIPVISMAFYYYLTEIKRSAYKVILYTSFISPNDVITNWEKCYNHFFDPNHKIKIYNRSGLCVLGEECSNESILSDLIIKS